MVGLRRRGHPYVELEIPTSRTSASACAWTAPTSGDVRRFQPRLGVVLLTSRPQIVHVAAGGADIPYDLCGQVEHIQQPGGVRNRRRRLCARQGCPPHARDPHEHRAAPCERCVPFPLHTWFARVSSVRVSSLAPHFPFSMSPRACILCAYIVLCLSLPFFIYFGLLHTQFGKSVDTFFTCRHDHSEIAVYLSDPTRPPQPLPLRCGALYTYQGVRRNQERLNSSKAFWR